MTVVWFSCLVFPLPFSALSSRGVDEDDANLVRDEGRTPQVAERPSGAVGRGYSD